MATRKERFWYIDRRETDESLTPDESTAVIGLVEKSTTAVTNSGFTSDYKSISEAGSNNLRLYCICLDDDIAAGTNNSYFNIPTQFHEALVYKVISMGYKTPPAMDLPTAQYFDTEYAKIVKEGKKFARSNYIQTGMIAPQDF